MECVYNRGASIRFLTSKELGIFDSVSGKDAARTVKGVIEVSEIMKPGDVIESVRSSDDRVAYIITQGTDVIKSSRVAEEALKLMKVQVQEKHI